MLQADRLLLTQSSFVWDRYREAGAGGGVYEELHPSLRADQRALVLKPFLRLSKGRQGVVVNALKRFIDWLTATPATGVSEWWRCSPMVLGLYLASRAEAARTAAATALSALTWWEEKLGVPLPVGMPPAADYAVGEGHTEEPAIVLEALEAFDLLRLAAASSGQHGIVVKLVAFVMMSCVRFQHLLLSRVTSVSPRIVTFWCTKGKRIVRGARPGFAFAVPRAWWPGYDIFGDLLDFWRVMRSKAGFEHGLLPALSTGGLQGLETVWRPQPMRIDAFRALMRSVLVESGMSEEAALQRKYNSLRRVLPTGGDTLASI